MKRKFRDQKPSRVKKTKVVWRWKWHWNFQLFKKTWDLWAWERVWFHRRTPQISSLTRPSLRTLPLFGTSHRQTLHIHNTWVLSQRFHFWHPSVLRYLRGNVILFQTLYIMGMDTTQDIYILNRRRFPISFVGTRRRYVLYLYIPL